MVKNKMENRMNSVEKEIESIKGDVGTIKMDLGSVKEFLTEMRELMRLRDEKEERRNRDKSSSSKNHNSMDGRERSMEGTSKKEEKQFMRLEMPTFNGEDPLEWTFKAERYFSMNHYEEAERMEAVAVCMEGKALNWFQWVESQGLIHSWTEFKTALVARF